MTGETLALQNMKSRDGKINIWKEDNNKALIDEAENAEFHSLSNQTLRSQTDQTPNPFGQSKPDSKWGPHVYEMHTWTA